MQRGKERWVLVPDTCKLILGRCYIGLIILCIFIISI